MTLEFQAFT